MQLHGNNIVLKEWKYFCDIQVDNGDNTKFIKRDRFTVSYN